MHAKSREQGAEIVQLLGTTLGGDSGASACRGQAGSPRNAARHPAMLIHTRLPRMRHALHGAHRFRESRQPPLDLLIGNSSPTPRVIMEEMTLQGVPDSRPSRRPLSGSEDSERRAELGLHVTLRIVSSPRALEHAESVLDGSAHCLRRRND